MLRHHSRRTARRAAVAGLSLVELLVGVTIGLFVVGGGLSVFARNLIGARKVLAETRLNQDLRSAVDLVTRDVRRAGYWGNAIQGTQTIGSTAATTPNPYASVTAPSSTELNYSFSADTGADNNTLDSAEQFGMRLNGGALQLRVASGNWVDITDSRAMTITSFTVTPTNTTLSLGQFCARTCTPGSPGCPTTTVRSVSIALQAQSVLDSTVQRSLRSTVRLRNDQLAGSCPP